MSATYDVPLSMKEIETIVFIVDKYRKQLLFELANTDSRELRVYVKERLNLLDDLELRFVSFLGGEPGDTEPAH